MLLYDGRDDRKAPVTTRTVAVVSADRVEVLRDMMTWRRNGREDWSLFYCEAGCLHVDGCELRAGQAWLYAPRVPQRYTMYKNEHTVYHYLHFTGSDVAVLLAPLGIEPSTVLTVADTGFWEIFARICEDMREEGALSALRAEYHTLQLLSRLAVRRADTSVPYRLRRVIDTMEHAFVEDYDAARYAAIVGVSVSRFNHLFRETVGIPPYAYYVRLRMENACGLLTDTAMPVGEIARRCGYEDALYFAQVFRRQTGLSPTAYRKKNRIE